MAHMGTGKMATVKEDYYALKLIGEITNFFFSSLPGLSFHLFQDFVGKWEFGWKVPDYYFQL